MGHLKSDERIDMYATTGAVGKVVEFDSSPNLLYYQQEEFKGFGTNATTDMLHLVGQMK